MVRYELKLILQCAVYDVHLVHREQQAYRIHEHESCK